MVTQALVDLATQLDEGGIVRMTPDELIQVRQGILRSAQGQPGPRAAVACHRVVRVGRQDAREVIGSGLGLPEPQRDQPAPEAGIAILGSARQVPVQSRPGLREPLGPEVSLGQQQMAIGVVWP